MQVEQPVKSWILVQHIGVNNETTCSLTRQAIRTPRAAAVAGIIFSILFTISTVLIRLAIPEDLSGTNIAAWLQGNTTTISLALTLVPFAGIAFLWFVAWCVRG